MGIEGGCFFEVQIRVMGLGGIYNGILCIVVDLKVIEESLQVTS